MLSAFKKVICNFYLWLFSKNKLIDLNDRILHLALRVRGFNNYEDSKASGEHFFVSQILRSINPKICIDIGANTGDYSKMILSHTNSRVVAFEPVSSTFTRLKESLAAFSERAHLVQSAVGDKNCKSSIYRNVKNSGHSSLLKEAVRLDYIQQVEKEAIDVVTLDSFLEKSGISQVDLIKIDVEGFEAEVIKGAMSSIKKMRPKFIQIEFNAHQMLRGKSILYFSEILKDYDVYQLLKDNWVKRCPLDPLSNVYYFSNFVFVRSTSN